MNPIDRIFLWLGVARLIAIGCLGAFADRVGMESVGDWCEKQFEES